MASSLRMEQKSQPPSTASPEASTAELGRHDGEPQSNGEALLGSPTVAAAPADTAMPAFARHYPKDPELRELVAAFERGAYHVVRERAPRLAESASDPKVVEAARDLRRRIEPDPLAVKMLLGAVVLLVILSVWAYFGQR